MDRKIYRIVKIDDVNIFHVHQLMPAKWWRKAYWKHLTDMGDEGDLTSEESAESYIKALRKDAIKEAAKKKWTFKVIKGEL